MSRGLSPVSTGGTCSGDSQKDLEGTLMHELMGDILGIPTSTWGNSLWRVVSCFWARNIGGAFSRISLKQYPVKSEHHNHVAFFSPTGLGIFTFISLRNTPLSLSWDKLIGYGWQFFCWGYYQNWLAGSHWGPVWWPSTTLLCSISQQSYNLTSRRPVFVPAFFGPLQGCPLAIYRRK